MYADTFRRPRTAGCGRARQSLTRIVVESCYRRINFKRTHTGLGDGYKLWPVLCAGMMELPVAFLLDLAKLCWGIDAGSRSQSRVHIEKKWGGKNHEKIIISFCVVSSVFPELLLVRLRHSL